ncbi:MAG TPA: calcium-binding protein [Nocardioides sp.]|uniref:calcium-binding protein n=1 Tax=uncultured Nocardioides sp. TaxID=198441 RepID=UPI00260A2D23|nr:calcium-binding protein [uncultured Nocardioides sp.]HRD64182.1 calcium-binding protein [Nocardioides sp.]HRI97077.1 calcium-binding protein [Nocardioides sp.]
MIARTTALAGIVLAGVVLVSPPAEARGARVLLDNGKLTVIGTDSSNTIVITRAKKAVKVKVDGKKIRIGKPIKPRKVKQIEVQGRGGNDTVRLVEKAGPLPKATLNGGPGNDDLTGGSGKTTLIGGPGNDRLVGGPGQTTMIGGNDDDALVGGAGAATMDAGGGNDTAQGGSGSATVDLGPGNDSFQGGTGPVVVDGGVGSDTLVAGPAVSAQLFGGADPDVVTGGTGTADLRGEGAPDKLTAGTGPTVMNGGDGPDQLRAGAQTSQVTGELGDDTFMFGESFAGGAIESFGPSSITDFGIGADTVKLFTGLSVHTGLGTTAVTAWDGATDRGTITAANGHLWDVANFS